MLVWQKAENCKLVEGKKYWLIRFYNDVRPIRLKVCSDGVLETIVRERDEPQDYIVSYEDMKFEE